MQRRLDIYPTTEYSVAKGENEIVKKIEVSWNLVHTLSDDKYLPRF